ncbi:hypothetical protein [Sphingobium phenoxybenzoativorans]|uniref:hypothetical protein n=1 Tax=Sphingobium phenoxybenzoativorans TaxID=1592790 RepID=UPI0014957EFA|nr:hypothetical protein [Sphingobium phenoxybenzoativorans]
MVIDVIKAAWLEQVHAKNGRSITGINLQWTAPGQYLVLSMRQCASPLRRPIYSALRREIAIEHMLTGYLVNPEVVVPMQHFWDPFGPPDGVQGRGKHSPNADIL